MPKHTSPFNVGDRVKYGEGPMATRCTVIACTNEDGLLNAPTVTKVQPDDGSRPFFALNKYLYPMPGGILK